MRRTIARSAEFAGSGLFNGRPCTIRVSPALAGSGITFHTGGGSVPALAAYRTSAARRTTLSSGAVRIDTVEHFLAAVAAIGLDDLDVAVTGGEIPIGDGSFAPFIGMLQDAGTNSGPSKRRIVINETIEVVAGEGRYRIAPSDVLQVDVTLEYSQPVIGRQRFSGAVSTDWFVTEIAPARTFGFTAEIERAQRQGEMLGAVDGSGVGLEADRVVNTTLRWPDEFVRHKVGDLLGDLALLGAPLHARITAVRPSHEGNFACVQAILDVARFPEE